MSEPADKTEIESGLSLRAHMGEAILTFYKKWIASSSPARCGKTPRNDTQ